MHHFSEIDYIEWRLAPGVKLRICDSKFTIRINRRKHALRDYFVTTLKKLQVEPMACGFIDANEQDLPAPAWLLREVAECLAECAADPRHHDQCGEAPQSKS